jgi:hypothetical protein
VFKYLPFPWAIGAGLLVCSALAYGWILGGARTGTLIERLLGSRVLTAALFGAIVFATWRLYPIADALKRQGRGTTADDALIVPLQTWIAGRPLYSSPLTGGVAASPGPGWIFVNAPFTLTGGYFLLTACYVGWLWVAIARDRRSIEPANRMLLLLVSSLAFWELTVIGHDIVATSCAIGALLLWTVRAFERRSMPRTALLAIAWGTLATARILYPFLIPLLGLLLWKRDARLAGALVAVALATTALWHLPFLLTNHPYDPFHLWDRARGGMGLPLIAAGGLATLAIGAAAWSQVTREARSVLGWFFACFLVPLVFISAGELFAVGGQLARWEGANYLIPTLGPFFVWLSLEPASSARPAAELAAQPRDFV